MENCLCLSWSQLALMLEQQNASPCGVDVDAGDGPGTQSSELDHVQQPNLTHKLQLAVIKALVSEQLLQKSHDLTGAILVCLWQVDVAQIQHQFA